MVKLDSTIVHLDFYPKGRVFTEFEAFVDFQLNQQIPRETLPERWGWTPSEVIAFFSAYKVELTGKKYQAGAKSIRLYPELAQQVCALFKEVFGRRASCTPSRIKMISARVREGEDMGVPVGLAQFRGVFEYKKKQWGDDPKMKIYLRTKTLCNGENFFEYLEEARAALRAEQESKKQSEKGIVLETKAFK